MPFIYQLLWLSVLAVLLKQAFSQNDCQPEAMSRCTNPLKVVTDNKDLGFATSLEELREVCPKLMEGLRCIDDFTLRCLDRDYRVYFNTLYTGTTQVIIDLCQEGDYQKDYLKHAPCMRHVQGGYEKCAAEYQVQIKALNEKSKETGVTSTYEYYEEQQDESEIEFANDNSQEANSTVQEVLEPRIDRQMRQAAVEEYIYEDESAEENVRLLCCSFQRYLHCSESVVNITCGSETAQFTKSFLDRMSGPLIQGHCQAYEFNNNGCNLSGQTNYQHASHILSNDSAALSTQHFVLLIQMVHLMAFLSKHL